MTLAVAVHCTSGLIYRNVRSLDTIKEELDAESAQYVHIPPAEKKMGSWEVVLVFKSEEDMQNYEKGELKAPWDLVEKEEARIINPLKASKRAARGG